MIKIGNERLPRVFPSHIEKGWGFREMRDRYHEMAKEPLVVTIDTATGHVGSNSSGAINLDGLLSAAVLSSHPCSPKYDEQEAVVPLPLDLLWLSPKGFPLWACSYLAHFHQIVGNEYWHKRFPDDRMEFAQRKVANTSAGQYREYRVPVRTHAPGVMKGVCIGNKNEVERLLDVVTHVGKKTAIGYGRVLSFSVRSVDVDQDSFMPAVLSRPIPIAAAQALGLAGAPAPNEAWTPPYWVRKNWADCLVPTS